MHRRRRAVIIEWQMATQSQRGTQGNLAVAGLFNHFESAPCTSVCCTSFPHAVCTGGTQSHALPVSAVLA